MSWKQLPIPFLGMMGLNSSQGERDYETTERDTVANPRATETPVSTKRKRDAPSPGESPIFEQLAKRKPPPKIVKYQRSSNSTPTPQPDGQSQSEGSGGGSSVPASDVGMSSEASNSQQTTAKRRARSGAKKKKEETAHFQPGHVSRTNAKHTGFFSPEEVRTLEQFKIDFCNENNITPELFDRLVQDSRKNRDGRLSLEGISRTAFWQSVYNLLPQRDRRSVYRFMRRHFQASSQKPHQWTKEQDDELEQMHAQYGPKWAKIARELGRTQDDVVQRWKNHVEHRRTLKWGPWSEEEIEALQNALRHSWTALHDSGVDVGKDIYEMDESLISWGVVSNLMDNTRSRQQCADRWRKIKRAVLEERRAGNPDAVYRPGNLKPRRKREGDSDQPSKRRSNSLRTMKSKERVSSEDLDSDDSDFGESEQPAMVKGENGHGSPVGRETRTGEPRPELGQEGDHSDQSGLKTSAEPSESDAKGEPEEVAGESDSETRQPPNSESRPQKGLAVAEKESARNDEQPNTTLQQENGRQDPLEKTSAGSTVTPGSGLKSASDLSKNATAFSPKDSASSSNSETGSDSDSDSESDSESDSGTDSDTDSGSDSDSSDSDSDDSPSGLKSAARPDSGSTDSDSTSSSAPNSKPRTESKVNPQSKSDSDSDSDFESDSDSSAASDSTLIRASTAIKRAREEILR